MLPKMNQARKSILDFFSRDLAVIRATGTPEQIAEIPMIEQTLRMAFEPEPQAVNFATTAKEKEEGK